MTESSTSNCVTICVHEFTVGDVEDPVLYAGEPLHDWQNTDSGRWVLENSLEPPTWYRTADINYYGYKFIVMAKLTEHNALFYKLKWG